MEESDDYIPKSDAEFDAGWTTSSRLPGNASMNYQSVQKSSRRWKQAGTSGRFPTPPISRRKQKQKQQNENTLD
jgi:hypothetical protein